MTPLLLQAGGREGNGWSLSEQLDWPAMFYLPSSCVPQCLLATEDRYSKDRLGRQ